jgi:hypothetical protein
MKITPRSLSLFLCLFTSLLKSNFAGEPFAQQSCCQQLQQEI